MYFFIFYEQNFPEIKSILVSPSSGQTYNVESEGLTRGIQLPVIIGIDLCKKLYIKHQQGLLATELEH